MSADLDHKNYSTLLLGMQKIYFNTHRQDRFNEIICINLEKDNVSFFKKDGIA